MPVRKAANNNYQSAIKQNKPLLDIKGKSNSVLILCGILLFTLLVYSNSINNGFTNWDDDSHVTANDDIKSLSPASIGKMFKPTEKYMYHPITILSYAINYKFSGLKPKGYHVTNLLLHLLSVSLVFYIMFLLFKRTDTAAVTSLLFAIHPLTTEPVNWVTGRKDVLFAFFFLASLAGYLMYLNKNKNIGYYACSIVLFVLSMLSKPMAASLPVVLFLIDIYFSRKATLKVILEKIPFVVIAVVIVLIPILHAHHAPVNPDAFGYSFHKSVPFENRIFLSCFALIFYLIKFFIPSGLSAYHGFPPADNGLPLLYYLSPALIFLIAFAAYKSGQYRKQVLFGLLFYLATIVLVVHLIPFGTNIYLAERYAYIPSFGIIFIAGSFYNKVIENAYSKNKKYTIAILSVVVIFFSYITYNQNKVWKDSTALWTNVIENAPDDFYGYFNRGNEEKRLTDTQGAITDYNEAITLNPGFMEAYYNRGIAKGDINDYKGAIADFTKAVDINPRYYVGWFNRGNSKAALQDFSGAIADYNEAIMLKADYKEAFSNRGNAKGAMKDFAGSIEDYNRVIVINPEEAQAYGNRGVSKLNLNDQEGACEDWRKAASLGDEHSDQMLQRFCK